jgi:hypothetical protein
MSDGIQNYINPDEGATLNGRHFKPGVNTGFVGELCPIGDRMPSKPSAGLNRIWHYIEAGIPFVQLTAFRKSLLLAVNRERNHKMFQTFRTFGLSGIRVLGTWNETDPKTSAVSLVEEDSFFIPLTEKSKLMPDELADLAEIMSLQYDQDAFLFGDGKSVHLFDFINHEIVQIGPYETLDTHMLEQAWSRARSNEEKPRKPAAGQKWAWGFPSDQASKAIQVGPYMSAKLSGT